MGLARFAAMLAMAGLAGCAALVTVSSPPATGPEPHDPIPQDCGATRLSGWVGQPVAALDEQYLPVTVRVLAPGDPVTEDYSPARLNILLDGAGRITEFRCG